MEGKRYTIDAEGRTIGRVASEAAYALRGKRETSFVPYKTPEVRVIVTNASKMRMSEKKRRQKHYTRFSGYPSGLKRESLERIIARPDGYERVLRHAIRGMLASNKLRDKILKQLRIEA